MGVVSRDVLVRAAGGWILVSVTDESPGGRYTPAVSASRKPQTQVYLNFKFILEDVREHFLALINYLWYSLGISGKIFFLNVSKFSFVVLGVEKTLRFYSEIGKYTFFYKYQVFLSRAQLFLESFKSSSCLQYTSSSIANFTLFLNSASYFKESFGNLDHLRGNNLFNSWKFIPAKCLFQHTKTYFTVKKKY